MSSSKTSIFKNLTNAFTGLSGSQWFILYSIFVIFISFFTFFLNYQNPPALFWDENYHIASSQKYIDGTFFLEPHPPLGKLFIALGEEMFQQNKVLDKSEFNKTDYVKSLPEANVNGKVVDFSFVGVRFFPVLFAFLSGYLFFVLLYLISRNSHISFAFSFLFLFDNAMIVHFRGAMLESTQLFFILLSLLYFVYSLQRKTLNWFNYFFLGALVSLVVATKINGLVLIILPLFFIIKETLSLNLEEYWLKAKNKLFKNNKRLEFSQNVRVFIKFLDKIKVYIGGFFVKALAFVFTLGFVFVFIQYIHQVLAKNVVDNRTYETSQSYRDKLSNGGNLNPLNALETTKQWYDYQKHYTDGVPKLDETKADENGSYPTTWLVGRRAISYRWQKFVIQTDKHNTYNPFEGPNMEAMSLDDYGKLPANEKSSYLIAVQYLYLVINPFNWFVGLLGLILATSLILGVIFFKLKIKNNETFNLILVFTVLYYAYMAAVLPVNRVLYLYHYFVPLVFSYILSFLVFKYIFEEGLESIKVRKFIYTGLAVFVITIVAVFIFYAPFSYYLPLSKEEFQARNLFSFWGMRSAE